MPILRPLALVLVLLTALPAHAQTAKTLLQQASPIVDTLAARLQKLVRDVEAAGPDMPKVRGLTEKSRQDNERLEGQLADIRKQMTPEEAGELDVYTQLKTGKTPDKLKVALEKAAKEAAELAAKVGPATVAKYRETIGQLTAEGVEHVKHLRDADAGKREPAWKNFVAWDAKRHQLVHAIRKDSNVVEPGPLAEEAETALQPLAIHAARLYRLGAQPPCPELQKELALAPARAKPIAELEPLFQKASNASQLRMAQAALAQAQEQALEVTNAELTQDEADEVRDTVREAMAPALKRLAELAAKAATKGKK